MSSLYVNIISLEVACTIKYEKGHLFLYIRIQLCNNECADKKGEIVKCRLRDYVYTTDYA